MPAYLPILLNCHAPRTVCSLERRPAGTFVRWTPPSGAPIDYSAGIIIHAKTGCPIKKGQPLATLYTSTEEKASVGEKQYLSCVTYSDTLTQRPPLLY
jgi:thymidine phosphorylase